MIQVPEIPISDLPAPCLWTLLRILDSAGWSSSTKDEGEEIVFRFRSPGAVA